MTFYIPGLMILSEWGRHYSIDALLRSRNQESSPNPHDDHWRFVGPVKVVLLLLSFLFFTDIWFKAQGVWLTDFEIIPKITLMHNILGISVRGYEGNPQSIFIASTPLIFLTLHAASFLFQGSFWLSLFSRRLCHLFIANAVLFHSYNVFVMNIHFNALLLVYFMFVDWQYLFDRVFGARLAPLAAAAKRHMTFVVAASILSAFVVAGTWDDRVRNLFENSTESFLIWYVVAPIALVSFVYNAIQLAIEANRYCREGLT